MSAGPIDVSFVKKNFKVGTVLWVGYPGEDGEPNKTSPDEPFDVLHHPESNQAIDISEVNCQNSKHELLIGVSNEGLMDGSNVVLVFWKPAIAKGITGTPNVQLVGFEKVEVKKPGEESVRMELDVCKDLSILNQEEGGNL
ncbi:hypothetical protein ACH5RR_022269 [Cinchona calisaya]|uniref:Fibronectin type III-like domain-containing protein n=1 Tax=Cinchona calisaya TaxID=153742 RepID=A0ABD2Z7B4_9GENT